jgi:hypothetical protein
MAMNNYDEIIERLTAASTEKGMLQERNRIMAILIKYRRAGWIDNATAHLLAQDISVED